jgi:hypothetical protein
MYRGLTASPRGDHYQSVLPEASGAKWVPIVVFGVAHTCSTHNAIFELCSDNMNYFFLINSLTSFTMISSRSQRACTAMKSQLPNESATRDDAQRREPTEAHCSDPAPGHQRPSAVTSLSNESSKQTMKRKD